MVVVDASPKASVADRALANHLLVGASTGAFAANRGHWPELVAASARLSSSAIELAALSEHELPDLIAYLSSDVDLPFRFVSVHGPVKGLTADEQSLVEELAALPSTVDVIVLHPDSMQDVAKYRLLGSRLVLENMDSRKEDGRTVTELHPFFEHLPDARFCLDVAHAWSIDPTMELANDLLDAYRTRLSHVHVSSVTSDCEHVALRQQDYQLFEPVLSRCIDRPWIVEAYNRELD